MRVSVDGDVAMLEPEIADVLKALRMAGLHVVAIHHHIAGEQPRMLFVHFWGRGQVEDLAKGFRAALDVLKKYAGSVLLVVLCQGVPDLANLSISKSQDRIYEKGKRLLFAGSAVALEAALREKKIGDEVLALAWGEESNREVLRRALAMGADRAVWTPGDPAEAVRSLGPCELLACAHSPAGADPLPWRIAGRLDLGPESVRVVEPGAFAPRIPNALAAMKAARREIGTIAAPPDGRLARRWATLVAAEDA